MVGPDTIKKIRPRPKWIRQKVGYFALLVGALFAKIKVSGRWHLPRNGPYIIASNHFSYVDPAFFKYAVQKPISFLAASDREIENHFMWFVFLKYCKNHLEIKMLGQFYHLYFKTPRSMTS